MSIFSNNTTREYPGQVLIKKTINDYFVDGPGFHTLLILNPDSEHLGYLSLVCGQILYNINPELVTYGVQLKNVDVEHINDYRYKFNIICDVHQGSYIFENINYVSVDVEFNPPI